MTMDRDALVERVALKLTVYMGCEDCGTGPGECPCRDAARAALAVIEPAVREECIAILRKYDPWTNDACPPPSVRAIRALPDEGENP